MELDQVQELVDLANTICPYSKATEGNIPTETVAVASLGEQAASRLPVEGADTFRP